MSMLFNFTIGLIGAVVAFIFSLIALIQTYQASLLAGLTFFVLASLAALSFIMTWLIGFYIAAAGISHLVSSHLSLALVSSLPPLPSLTSSLGVVYVSASTAAQNLRLEDGDRGRRRLRD